MLHADALTACLRRTARPSRPGRSEMTWHDCPELPTTGMLAERAVSPSATLCIASGSSCHGCLLSAYRPLLDC
jgi:hypothetical protein